MNLLESIGNGVSRAMGYVVDKNHRAALANRVRVVIKNERENTARAYVALGKYYAENLRDPDNQETEHLCRAVEESSARMRRAFDRLDELTCPDSGDDEAYWDECAGCDGDCQDCCDCDDCGPDGAGWDDDLPFAAAETPVKAPAEAPTPFETEGSFVAPDFTAAEERPEGEASDDAEVAEDE